MTPGDSMDSRVPGPPENWYPISPKELLKMARRRGQRKGWLRMENGSWLLTYRVYRYDPQTKKSGGDRETVTIGPAVGPGRLTEKQAERFAWDHYLSKVDQAALKPKSVITLEEFWKGKYLAHLQTKKTATRKQYISLWRNWIKPTIGDVRLADLTPEHTQSVIDAALAKEKSSETAKHIRKVMSAIFSYAKVLQFASGDNPATLLEPPPAQPVRTPRALTWEQCKTALDAFPTPVKEMSLTSIATSMNVSELTGLKIKYLNLTAEWKTVDAESIPPFHVAVREHNYRGKVGSLKAGKRKRNVPLPTAVVSALRTLIDRKKFTSPDDPVFVTRAGTAVNENNLAKRILKPIAVKIEMPWLSWHCFRHTNATLSKMVNMSDTDRMALMGHGSMEMTDRYTHEDRERMRAGVEKIVEGIYAATGTDNVAREKPRTGNVIQFPGARKQDA